MTAFVEATAGIILFTTPEIFGDTHLLYSAFMCKCTGRKRRTSIDFSDRQCFFIAKVTSYNLQSNYLSYKGKQLE